MEIKLIIINLLYCNLHCFYLFLDSNSCVSSTAHRNQNFFLIITVNATSQNTDFPSLNTLYYFSPHLSANFSSRKRSTALNVIQVNTGFCLLKSYQTNKYILWGKKLKNTEIFNYKEKLLHIKGETGQLSKYSDQAAGWRKLRNRGSIPGRCKIFYPLLNWQPRCGGHLISYNGPSLEVTQKGCEPGHSPPSNSEFRNEQNHTSIPPFAFMTSTAGRIVPCDGTRKNHRVWKY